MDGFVKSLEILKKNNEETRKHEVLVRMITEVAEVRRVAKHEEEKIAKLQQEVAKLREEHSNLKIDVQLAKGVLESKKRVLQEVENEARQSEDSLEEAQADFASFIREYNENIEKKRECCSAMEDEENEILEKTRKLHDENHQLELKCCELQGEIDATQMFVDYQDRRTNNLKKFLDEL